MLQRRATTGALMALLQNDEQLNDLATGGVHLVRQPQDVPDIDPDNPDPFVTVRRYGGRVVQSLGQAIVGRYVRYSIVARVPGSGGEVAELIDERLHALLSDTVLTLDAPLEASPLRRMLDIDEPVIDEGVEFDQVGGMYEVFVSGGTG